MLAAQNGQTEMVAELLDRGAYTESKTSEGCTALMIAAKNGHTETVALLLDRGADVNASTFHGITALMLAAEDGQTEIVAKLLDRGADINAEESEGCTALMIAAQNGNTETVALLLDRGANVLARENYVKAKRSSAYRPALFLAAQNGHIEIVAKLLDRGANINAIVSESDCSTALISAAKNGHTETVALLLDRGAHIEAKTTYPYYTALMIAAQNGQTEMVAELLDRGAYTESKTSEGCTALMIAAKNGHTETVALLLDLGANIEATTTYFYTALMLAAQNGHTETVSALLSRDGIDVNAVASNGVTALMLAAYNGHAETVSALLSRDGVDWQIVQDQLRHPGNLNTEVSTLLAVIVPEGELRNSIITSFNQRNPENAIQQENNDILGAGIKAYKTLKDLKSWHKRYLTDPDSDLGHSENEAEILANQRFFDLLNHQDARQETLKRNGIVKDLVDKESLFSPLEGSAESKKEFLKAASKLGPEDLYRLKSEILDNSKVLNEGNPTLEALSLVAELPKNTTDQASASPAPSAAEKIYNSSKIEKIVGV